AVEGLTRQLTKARLDTDPRGKAFRPRFVSRWLRYAQTHQQPNRENYDALELEKANLLNAVDIAFNLGDWRDLSQIASILAVAPDAVFVVRGLWDLALQICRQALNLGRSLGHEREIAAWSHNLAVLYQRRGELEEVQQL